MSYNMTHIHLNPWIWKFLAWIWPMDMKLRGAPFHKVNIFSLFITVSNVFDPRNSTYFFNPRSRDSAREHFSKIQEHLISAFFVVSLGFWPLRIRISAWFFDSRLVKVIVRFLVICIFFFHKINLWSWCNCIKLFASWFYKETYQQ